jgi:4-amino-4-deoxy-L-arabinose transferase-like glycosyltransferase
MLCHTNTPGNAGIAALPWAAMVVIALAFLAARGPQLWLQAGGQDEDWFAVPGWTVAREGVPRAPYAPYERRESAFYRADAALFALPPAYFYWQAPLYWVLPPGYGVARLASALAGILALVFTWRLGVMAYQSHAIALTGVALFSLSRVFFFPAITARPDALCGALGLGAVLAVWHWRERPSWRVLLAAGVLLGLGMLSHPFAIVYCLQCGVWTLWPRQGWRPNLGAAAALTATAMGAFALWLPLILMYPDVFKTQFFNNVIHRSETSVLERALWPFDSFAYHARLLWEHAGPAQLGLMLGGLMVATALDLRREPHSARQIHNPKRKRGNAGDAPSLTRRVSVLQESRGASPSLTRRAPHLPGAVTLVVLAWSSVHLLVVFQGLHPTKGYWLYPAAFCFLCVGRVLAGVVRSIPQGNFRRAAAAVLATAVLALLAPGSGARAWLTYVRHGGQADYNRSKFVEQLLKDLPPDAKFIVDPAYVFDFYLAGRDTTLGVNAPFYFLAEGRPYDYYVASRYGLKNQIPAALGGRRIAVHGRPDDPLANYAEIYVPGRKSR